MSRLGLVVSTVLAVLALSGCDGFIEQVRVTEAGTVDFDARATVACLDELTEDIWGDGACATIDSVARGDEPVGLPFGFAYDPTRAAVVVDGTQDRRRIDVTWEGSVEEFGSVLVERVRIDRVDESTAEMTLTPGRSPAAEFLATPGAATRLADAGWPAPELRVVAPAVIVEHNGDEINGRTVSWFFDGDRPEELRVRWDLDGPERRYWWWIVGGTILVAVLFMMVTLEGSPGRNDDSA